MRKREVRSGVEGSTLGGLDGSTLGVKSSGGRAPASSDGKKLAAEKKGLYINGVSTANWGLIVGDEAPSSQGLKGLLLLFSCNCCCCCSLLFSSSSRYFSASCLNLFLGASMLLDGGDSDRLSVLLVPSLLLVLLPLGLCVGSPSLPSRQFSTLIRFENEFSV